MTKTAVDLHAARAGSGTNRPRAKREPARDRKRNALELAERIAGLLRERYAATRVVLFGSLAHGAWFTLRSDLDIAAWGIPKKDFYRAVASVIGISADFEVDLVDGEACPNALSLRINREGIDL